VLVTAALGSGAGGATNTAQKPTKSEIVIGQISALTGAAAASWSQDTAKVWQKWVNANGGINDHPVKVVSLDSKQDPAVAQSKIKELIQQDKIIALVGENDQTIQSWMPLLEDAKVPAIGGTCYFGFVVCSGKPGSGASPLFFSVTTTVPAITDGIIVSAHNAGKKKFGGVVCAEVASCAQVEIFYKTTTPAIGMKYGGIVKVSASQADYNAECLQLKQNGVDSAQLAVFEGVALRVVQDCATQGYKPFWGVSAGTGSEANLKKFSQILNGPINGEIDGFPWWANDPQVKTFRAAFKKYGSGKKYQDSTATATWAAFELFRKAMANASDNPTSQEVIDAMYKLKDEDLGGLLPQKLTYTQGQPAPFINCFWLDKYDTKTGLKVVQTSDPSGNSKTSGDLKSDCYQSALTK
jgi:branched-chain amino acid transport system substrate-binding protein